MSDSKMPSVSEAQMQRAAFAENRAEIERQNRLAGLYEAEEIFNHLVKEIDDFECELCEDYEVGMRLANFGEAAQIHIRSISFQNPYLIEFHGLNSRQEQVKLIQHVSQLNFMLFATKPIEEKPFRIGFGAHREDDGEVLNDHVNTDSAHEGEAMEGERPAK